MNEGQILVWLVVAVVSAGIASIPILLYRHTVRRQRYGWDYVEPVTFAVGAYRGGTVPVARSPGVPRAVRAASMWSLFMLVPAIVSLPFMLLGFAMGAAPAFLFGPLGLVLAFFVVRAGYRLPQANRAAAEFARSVAYAEIIHNVFVVAFVVFASVVEGKTWELWAADKLGLAALVYAVASFGHAGYLLHAVDVHLRHAAPREEEPEAAPIPSVV